MGGGGGPHGHGGTGGSEPRTIIRQHGARARGDGARGRTMEMMTIAGVGVYYG